MFLILLGYMKSKRDLLTILKRSLASIYLHKPNSSVFDFTSIMGLEVLCKLMNNVVNDLANVSWKFTEILTYRPGHCYWSILLSIRESSYWILCSPSHANILYKSSPWYSKTCRWKIEEFHRSPRKIPSCRKDYINNFN